MEKLSFKSGLFKTLFWVVFAAAFYVCFFKLFFTDVQSASSLWVGAIAGALALLFAMLKIYNIAG